MRRVATAALTAALAGCAADTHVRTGLVSSTASSGAAVGIDIQGGSGFAALLGFGVLAAGMQGASSASREPPPLAEGRRVNIQDCSQPLQDTTGNLSCR